MLTGTTPLMIAASLGHTGVCEVLIAVRASVIAADAVGQTALHHAALARGCATARLLVGARADVEARMGSCFGVSPLMAAVLFGNAGVARALLELHAAVGAPSTFGPGVTNEEVQWLLRLRGARGRMMDHRAGDLDE